GLDRSPVPSLAPAPAARRSSARLPRGDSSRGEQWPQHLLRSSSHRFGRSSATIGQIQRRPAMLHLAVVLFLASPPAAEPAYFRLGRAPPGSQVSIGEPVVRSGMVVFHSYPDGKLMSLRRSDVKSTTRITAKEAAGPATTDPKPIANL